MLTPFAEAGQLKTDAIDAITRRPSLRRALWGVLVEDARGKVLYERNADTLMTPASVRKLFSATAALSCYGYERTLETTVWVTGVQVGHTLRGDLVVRGGGDPSLGGRYEYDSDRWARFQPILDALHRLGIERIEGDVVVDVSAFDDELIPGSWKSDNLGNSWAAPVDAIAFNENVIGVRVVGLRPASARVTLDPAFATYSLQEPCRKSQHTVGIGDGNVVTVGCSRSGTGELSYLLAVADPGLFAGEAIHSWLLNRGIVASGVRTTREPMSGTRYLASVPSLPVGMLLSAVLEESANLYAEMLLKSFSSGGGRPATYSESLQIERAFLTGIVRIGDDEFSFDDGCGLSPEDSVTPRATLQLLRYLESNPSWLYIVRAAVATPGKGTLRKRLKGLEGRVFAKTGSIDGVNALAGWTVGAKGEVRRFAIFINHHTASGATAKDAIDDIVRLISDF